MGKEGEGGKEGGEEGVRREERREVRREVRRKGGEGERKGTGWKEQKDNGGV